MKIWMILLVLLGAGFARAEETICPSPKDLASEIIEAELNGVWLTSKPKCLIPSKDIVINRIQEGFASPIYVACDKNPYRFLEMKEVEKDVFKFSVAFRVANPDGSCKEIAPSEVVYRLYRGKALSFFKSCVGVLSPPQNLVVRKECQGQENREPQSSTKKRH